MSDTEDHLEELEEYAEDEAVEMLDLAETPTEETNEFFDLFRSFDPNIDGLLLEKSFKQYDQVRQQVLLEGNEKAWMACAFYTSSYQSIPHGQEPVYQYSLLRLLKVCNLSILEFFDKLNRWIDMVNASRRVNEHIQRIQSTLAVSTVIYKKYLKIFRSLFQIHQPNDDEGVSTAQVFEFIWIALIAFKKCLPNGSEDLMKSYHILISLVEVVFTELQIKESPVLNPDFVNMVEENSSDVLDLLCVQFDGVELDAKHLKTHWFMPAITQMVKEEILTLPSGDNQIQFFDSYEKNREKLEALYQKHMMKKMEIDERMFISHVAGNIDMVFNESLDDSAITMLRRSDLDTQWAVDADLLLRMSTQSCLKKVQQFTAKPIQTPLTAKSYVISDEQFCPATPISSVAQRVLKLQEILNQDFSSFDQDFDRMVAQCRDNPMLFIGTRVQQMESLIERRVEEEKILCGEMFDAEFNASLPQRLAQVDNLFNRLLKLTVLYDKSRNPRADANDLSLILHKTDFITGLYIAALELVIMTFTGERDFPWSCVTLQLAPINFYKIIEVVIRADTELSREMVKHLNRIEEMVLDELSWSLDSPLWAALARKFEVPASNNVNGDTLPTPSSQHHPITNRYQPSPMKPLIKKRHLDYGAEDGVAPKQRHEDYPPSTSHNLFFRKFYYLAAVRLTDLCDRIRIDDQSRHKVWTIFEHVVRNETNLMAGRHLDQNMMCCLYIVAKIANVDTTFHKIIHQYRTQPQASSRIYRKVLVDPGVAHPTEDTTSRDSFSSVSNPQRFRSGSAVPATVDASSHSHTPEPTEGQYVDLIRYYNTVFVPRVEGFVKRIHPSHADHKENSILCAMMPKVTLSTLSPRRMVGDQLAVIPMSASRYPNRLTPNSSVQNTPSHRTIQLVRAARNTPPAY